jgi:hypothetical protein
VAKLAARLTLVSPDFDPRLILTGELEDELLARLRPTWLGDQNLLAMSVACWRGTRHCGTASMTGT